MVRNPLSVVRSWFLKRTEANVAAERAGMTFLTQVGVLGDRFTAMDGLNDENFLDWSSNFFRAALPWLLPRKEYEMAEKLIAWLENYEIYQTIVAINAQYKGIDQDVKEVIDVKEYTVEQLPPDKEISPIVLQKLDQDLKKFGIDVRAEGLDRSLERVKQFNVNDAKYLLGLSFRKEDLAASDTLIISKPEAGPPPKEHAESYEGMEMISERLNQMQKDLQELKEKRR